MIRKDKSIHYISFANLYLASLVFPKNEMDYIADVVNFKPQFECIMNTALSFNKNIDLVKMIPIIYNQMRIYANQHNTSDLYDFYFLYDIPYVVKYRDGQLFGGTDKQLEMANKFIKEDNIRNELDSVYETHILIIECTITLRDLPAAIITMEDLEGDDYDE